VKLREFLKMLRLPQIGKDERAEDRYNDEIVLATDESADGLPSQREPGPRD
jgi:hypothetical protein